MPVMDSREPLHFQPKEFFGFPVFADGDTAYENHITSDNEEQEFNEEQDFVNARPRQTRYGKQDSFTESPDDLGNSTQGT